jgi:hypothetical protein
MPLVGFRHAGVPKARAAYGTRTTKSWSCSQRKLARGNAVMRLRVNRAETFTKVADQLARSMTQLDQERQAALSRRASLPDALIKAIP